MGNNSTNISKTKNHISPQTLNTKRPNRKTRQDKTRQDKTRQDKYFINVSPLDLQIKHTK